MVQEVVVDVVVITIVLIRVIVVLIPIMTVLIVLVPFDADQEKSVKKCFRGDVFGELALHGVNSI